MPNSSRDELGSYDDDPLGRIGYLQSMNFRACRLVVDTGIHAKRWTFDRRSPGSSRRPACRSASCRRAATLLRDARPGLRLQDGP
jgi:hypothetical protein